MCCTHDVSSPVGITEVAERQQGVPSGMSRMRPEYPDPDISDWWVAADLLLRQEPDEEEERRGRRGQPQRRR
jgi:hypothetical protein